MRWQHRLTALYPLLSGTIFIGLGLLTLFQPDVFEYYSIGVDSASARTAIRAMVGGGEVGIGLVILCGSHLGFSINQRCTLAASIFLCVGLARLLSAAFEGELQLTSQPLREASIELFLGSLGAWVAAYATRNDLSD